MSAPEDFTATGHRLVDHTADIALEAWAPDEPTLLATLARGVIAVLTEHALDDPDEDPPPPGGALTAQRIEIEGLDPADRMVAWLNEILIQAITDGYLVRHAQITLDGDESLIARTQGWSESAHVIRTELKAITYHDLFLGPDEHGRWMGRVVIDV